MNNFYEKYKNIYKKTPPKDNKNRLNRWVVSYADFVTVLLAIFIVLWAGANIDINDKVQAKVQDSTSKFKGGGDNYLLDGVKNPSDSKDIKVIEFEKMAKNINADLGSKKSVEVLPEGSQITIRLGESVLFDEGSAIIKPESKRTLDILARELSKNTKKIRIEGHSDNIPIKSSKYASNWELSTIRATNIVTYLIENCNIDKDRLIASGYADNKPVIKNDTKEGRAKNRRVDIVIIN